MAYIIHVGKNLGVRHHGQLLHHLLGHLLAQAALPLHQQNARVKGGKRPQQPPGQQVPGGPGHQVRDQVAGQGGVHLPPEAVQVILGQLGHGLRVGMVRVKDHKLVSGNRRLNPLFLGHLHFGLGLEQVGVEGVAGDRRIENLAGFLGAAILGQIAGVEGLAGQKLGVGLGQQCEGYQHPAGKR